MRRRSIASRAATAPRIALAAAWLGLASAGCGSSSGAPDAPDGAAGAPDGGAGTAPCVPTELDYEASLTADFAYRDSLPQTDVPPSEWSTCCGTWGPPARTYPPAQIPCGVDAVRWQRDRAVAAARRFIGVPWVRGHIPAIGLDCSNFVAWVYNYAFGIRFSSELFEQMDPEREPRAGRLVPPGEPLQPGDLLYILDGERLEASHSGIYAGDGRIVDSTNGAVAERRFTGWYVLRFDHARRLFW